MPVGQQAFGLQVDRPLPASYLSSTTSAVEDPSEVETAWNQEIASRVRDVEDGKVELVSSEESERRLDGLFARYRVKRPE